MISPELEDLSLVQQCKLIGISRSGYCYKAKDLYTKALLEFSDTVFMQFHCGVLNFVNKESLLSGQLEIQAQ